MTVRINKPAINLRETLSGLDRKEGLRGLQILAAEDAAEAVEALDLENHTFDINGGTIDGTVIGGSTPAAISGTTGQFGTSLNVDGTVTADGLTVDGHIAQSGAAPAYTMVQTDATDLNTRIQVNGQSLSISTINDALNSTTERLRVNNSTGDISFYEDTGTTPKFFWDASEETLAIGASSATRVSTSYGQITLNGASGGILNFTDDGVEGVRLQSVASDFYIQVNADTIFRNGGFTGAQERMRIDSSGNVLCGSDGGGDIGSSTKRFKDLYLSGGVYLGGTTSANLLDDYEEGTFTPVVADAASGGNEGSAESAFGYYIKTGRQVTVQITFLNINTTGLTGANDLYITGLPFSAGSFSGSNNFTGSMSAAFLTSGADVVVPEIIDATSYVRLREWNLSSTGTDWLLVSELASGSADLNITLTYFAA